MSKDVMVKFNGVEITLKQLEEKQKEFAHRKDMQIVEVTPNVYVTRLYD